ncbi:hypothetical protein D3C80_2143400 [compost metagenome]
MFDPVVLLNRRVPIVLSLHNIVLVNISITTVQFVVEFLSIGIVCKVKMMGVG